MTLLLVRHSTGARRELIDANLIAHTWIASAVSTGGRFDVELRSTDVSDAGLLTSTLL